MSRPFTIEEQRILHDAKQWAHDLIRANRAAFLEETIRAAPAENDGNDDRCNTCGGTGRWISYPEDSPLQGDYLGPCLDCDNEDITHKFDVEGTP